MNIKKIRKHCFCLVLQSLWLFLFLAVLPLRFVPFDSPAQLRCCPLIHELKQLMEHSLQFTIYLYFVFGISPSLTLLLCEQYLEYKVACMFFLNLSLMVSVQFFFIYERTHPCIFYFLFCLPVEGEGHIFLE